VLAAIVGMKRVLKRVAPGRISERSGARIMSERPGAPLLQIEGCGESLMMGMLQ
jgi:hypothetical protein